ncbi:MAG: HD domain-containing protein [Thermoflexaceae bacterium]|nr:HD domain-containing protein [Thermoflexaceae bacterium]
MRYIDSLRDGDRITAVYLCKQKSTAMTKTGKEYENVILQDKTGSLDGKIWDPGSFGINEFEAMDYVEVTGRLSTFNGTLQLSIERARKCEEGEYDPKDYLPVSSRDINEMCEELMAYIKAFQNPYIKKLAESFFVEDAEFIRKFKSGSAAKSIHHGFVGGLLEHTLSVAKLCSTLADFYPILNKDLLVLSALLHDIGKTKELSAFPLNDYTDEGQLLGHIVMGVEMVDEKLRNIPDFPVKLASEIKHCIVAHHGEFEFGSPKKPALIEALVLSMADNLDAKIEQVTEIFNGSDSDDWLGYNRLLESNIRKSSK